MERLQLAFHHANLFKRQINYLNSLIKSDENVSPGRVNFLKGF